MNQYHPNWHITLKQRRFNVDAQWVGIVEFLKRYCFNVVSQMGFHFQI